MLGQAAHRLHVYPAIFSQELGRTERATSHGRSGALGKVGNLIGMKRRTTHAFLAAIAAAVVCLLSARATPAIDGPRPEGHETARRSRAVFGGAMAAVGAVVFSVAQMRRSRRELEQKLQEQTLATAESDARQQALFQNVALGVVRQDRAGSVVAMNHVAEQILGRSPDQLVGHPLFDG